MKTLTMHSLFTAFTWLIAIDFVSGTFRGWRKGKVQSRVCGDGLFRTMGECILLLILILFNRSFPQTDILLGFLLLAFIFKECISIIENLYQLGVWIPKWVKNGLEACVERIDAIDIKEINKEIKEKMEDK